MSDDFYSVDGYDSGDSSHSLFGDDGSGVFPFQTEDGDGADELDSVDGAEDAARDGENNIRSFPGYDFQHRESNNSEPSMARNNDPGATIARGLGVKAAAERRERMARDTGSNNIRRAATANHRAARKGEVGDEPKPASSIEQATDRLRRKIGGSGDRADHPAYTDNAGRTFKRGKELSGYVAGGNTNRGMSRPPVFTEALFEASVFKLMSNTAGDWMLTLKIPYEYANEATKLAKGYGVAIECALVAKQYEKD